ncbi:MAG: hypothetical protein IKN38_07620 [Clostridia bacterium]|nr:hypothetical protein [Clostridia bacterium]
MKYYNYSGKKSQSRYKTNRKKTIINIIIIVSAVALSVAFALILGNHLKNRLETADISTEPVETLIPAPDGANDDASSIDFVKNEHAEGEMSAIYGFLDLDGCPDSASASSLVDALCDCGYTGVIFNARNADGKYSYGSKAASEATRTEISRDVVSYDILASAIARAGARGMRSAVYIDLGDVFLTDEISALRSSVDRKVIKELAEMGFSGIILDGLTRDRDFTIDFVERIYSFISQLRIDCGGADIGMVIEREVLEDPENTPAVEMAFRFVDFFSMDFSAREGDSAQTVSSYIEKYSGSFSAYSILALMRGDDKASIRDGVAATAGEKHPNAAFLTPRKDYTVKDGEKLSFSSKAETYSLTAADTKESAAPAESAVPNE